MYFIKDGTVLDGSNNEITPIDYFLQNLTDYINKAGEEDVKAAEKYLAENNNEFGIEQ